MFSTYPAIRAVIRYRGRSDAPIRQLIYVLFYLAEAEAEVEVIQKTRALGSKRAVYGTVLFIVCFCLRASKSPSNYVLSSNFHHQFGNTDL